MIGSFSSDARTGSYENFFQSPTFDKKKEVCNKHMIQDSKEGKKGKDDTTSGKRKSSCEVTQQSMQKKTKKKLHFDKPTEYSGKMKNDQTPKTLASKVSKVSTKSDKIKKEEEEECIMVVDNKTSKIYSVLISDAPGNLRRAIKKCKNEQGICGFKKITCLNNASLGFPINPEKDVQEQKKKISSWIAYVRSHGKEFSGAGFVVSVE